MDQGGKEVIGGTCGVQSHDPAPGLEHPVLFTEIPWSTDQVFELTLQRAQRLGMRVHLLPEWFDVDTESDLRRLALEFDARPGGPWRTRRCVTSIYG